MKNTKQQKEIIIDFNQYQALLTADLRIEGLIAEIGQKYTMTCKDKESLQAVCINTFDYGDDSKTSIFLSVECYNRLKLSHSFQERINELREEIIQSIVNIMKSNGLQEIKLLDDEQCDITYVVWFDNDGNAYDSPVKKVSLDDDNSICLDVYDEYENISSTLYAYDLGCMHLDWLENIRENILYAIHKNSKKHYHNSIELSILDNGDLEIAVSNREEFEEIINKKFHDERAYLAELMENSKYIGNDWWCACNIGLTESPAIAQGAIYPEDENYDGEPTDYENLWYFPGYALTSYLEILQTEGKIVFTGHKDNISKRQKA
jgi:hypothetical protein